MPASFSLVNDPWIPVLDSDAATGTPGSGNRDVGLLEALTRAHRLHLAVTRDQDIPILRFLLAVMDAACGPRTRDEWRQVWDAPALDSDRITAYLSRWAHRLDVFDADRPALQCGHLPAEGGNRGPEALNPSSLAGQSGAWWDAKLRLPEHPPWPTAKAVVNMLFLLAYDVAGIKGAAPGPPADAPVKQSGGRVYGPSTGPVAAVTHLHIDQLGGTLKDLLLLNCPPQPRGEDDAPVWERDCPPATPRYRTPDGRLDWLTWPSRRIRLIPSADGQHVTGLSLHDGDRSDGQWTHAHALDPMTAWRATAKRTPAPQSLLSSSSWLKPWTAALCWDADEPAGSAVMQHLARVASHVDPGTQFRAVLSVVEHGSRHRSTISGIPVETTRLGTAAQIANAEARARQARQARYAEVLQNNLVKHAIPLSRQPKERVAQRMDLNELSSRELHDAWDQAVATAATTEGIESGRQVWGDALTAAADRAIDNYPLRMMDREKLRVSYPVRPVQVEAAEPKQTKGRKRRPRKGAALYEAFGRKRTLAEIAGREECVVSLPTLRNRVEGEEPWSNVEEAATTPARRGRPASPRTKKGAPPTG